MESFLRFKAFNGMKKSNISFTNKPFNTIDDKRIPNMINNNKAAVEPDKAAVEPDKAAVELDKAAVEPDKAAVEPDQVPVQLTIAQKAVAITDDLITFYYEEKKRRVKPSLALYLENK
ncbi:hypothetical protein KUCAC02_007005 [Chaenocephalus aceratus]|nr:hypothetical protein KUCAC02_007005 [Chaenocephalus aceratus]